MEFVNSLDKTSDRYKEINEALDLLKRVPKVTKFQETCDLKNILKNIKFTHCLVQDKIG
ncbi:MAG: hypothetical protein ACYDAJ_06235 [Nitrosotalea sp.]